LVDLFNLGHPDLLAGPLWKKDRPKAGSVRAIRQVDLDLKGKKPWEWVGPKSAVLLWGKTKPDKVDASVVFGNYTWGKNWANGYDALASLAKPGAKTLSGDDLANLWLWIDTNGDTIVDPKDVYRLTDFINCVSLEYNKDPVTGDVYQDNGFRLKGSGEAKWVKSWDWFSFPMEAGVSVIKSTSGAPEYVFPLQMGKKGDESSVCIYHWITDDGVGSGGYLRFIKSGKDVYVLAISDISFKVGRGSYAKVDVDGDSLSWTFNGVGSTDVNNVSIHDGVFLGSSVYTNRKAGHTAYTWTAVPVLSLPTDSIDLAADMVVNFSAKEFFDALLQSHPPSGDIRVMYGSGLDPVLRRNFVTFESMLSKP
jgi:hypothetical protein